MTTPTTSDAPKAVSEKVVFKESARSAMMLLAGSAAFVFMGYYNITEQPVGSMLYSISEFGIWFFALGIPIGLLQLFGIKLSVTLDSDGLLYRHHLIKIGPIPWQVIRSVTVASRGSTLSGRSRGILLIDVGDWRGRKWSSPESEMVATKVGGKFGNRSIRISASGLGTTAEKLTEAIRLRIDALNAEASGSSSR